VGTPILRFPKRRRNAAPLCGIHGVEPLLQISAQRRGGRMQPRQVGLADGAAVDKPAHGVRPCQADPLEQPAQNIDGLLNQALIAEQAHLRELLETELRTRGGSRAWHAAIS
jgi:hypothetical protein